MYPRLFHKGEGGKDACPFTFSLVSVDSYRIIQRRVVRRMEYKGRRSDSSLVKSRWLERDGLAGSLLLKRIYSIVLGSGFSGSSGGKESACYAGHPGLIPGSGRSPWRRKWQPTPVFLPGKSHGQRSLAGYSPWGCKESDTTEWLTHFKHSGISKLQFEGWRMQKAFHRADVGYTGEKESVQRSFWLPIQESWLKCQLGFNRKNQMM